MELTDSEYEALEAAELNINTDEEYISYPAAYEDYTDSYGQPVTAMDGKVPYVLTARHIHLDDVMIRRPGNNMSMDNFTQEVMEAITELYEIGYTRP